MDNNIFDFINALGLYSSTGGVISSVCEMEKEIKKEYLEAMASDDPYKKDIGLTFLYNAYINQSSALKTLVTSVTEAIIDATTEKTEGDDV